jgi:hypothetical protein
VKTRKKNFLPQRGSVLDKRIIEGRPIGVGFDSIGLGRRRLEYAAL